MPLPKVAGRSLPPWVSLADNSSLVARRFRELRWSLLAPAEPDQRGSRLAARAARGGDEAMSAWPRPLSRVSHLSLASAGQAAGGLQSGE